MAPRAATKNAATSALGCRDWYQADGKAQGHNQKQCIEAVDPLDIGLGPEAGAESEQQAREQSGNRGESKASAQEVEARNRCGGAEGAEEAHAEGDGANRNEDRPELSEKYVERVAARMWNAQRVDRSHQLAAVADVDGAAGAPGVDQEEGQPENEGMEPPGIFAVGRGCRRCGQASVHELPGPSGRWALPSDASDSPGTARCPARARGPAPALRWRPLDHP